MNLSLKSVLATPENGKQIADFLSGHFWKEHSLSDKGSPKIDWSRASAHINHFLFEGVVYNVLDGDTIIGSIAAAPDAYWWSAEQYIGDGWFYVMPEYRNIKDQTPPSHLLIDAIIEYAKRQDKPLILGIFNLDGVERAKKLFIKKGFHQIGGMYYKD
tara:strand:+ start:1140 stop:1613 length:474 start_codon:yes stop_codon:yes gene_type:complete